MQTIFTGESFKKIFTSSSLFEYYEKYKCTDRLLFILKVDGQFFLNCIFLQARQFVISWFQVLAIVANQVTCL